MDSTARSIRPSVIVGQSKNGFRANSEFGMYSFVKAAYLACKNNVSEICFDLDKSVRGNLICVDYLAQWALLLSERETVNSESIEILHASATKSLILGDYARVGSNVISTNIKLGPPKNEIDKQVKALTTLNAPFALRTWEFETKNLASILGDKYEAFLMDEQIAEIIVRTYIQDCESE